MYLVEFGATDPETTVKLGAVCGAGVLTDTFTYTGFGSDAGRVPAADAFLAELYPAA